MYDIMEQGVTLVEPVYLRREPQVLVIIALLVCCSLLFSFTTNPQPTMEAVYYLSPTEHSVECLIRDFAADENQYAGELCVL